MRHAFSLVELSIVLVILGLLTGGILAGQNLIRAAELRSITTEFQNLQTASMTFRNKYHGLPGDLINAEDFWGTMATGTCPLATAGTGTQTCNGDGDGIIDDDAIDGAYRGERYHFWKQLANAGLIEGSYTGVTGSANVNDSNIGENVPKSKMGNAGWEAVYRPITLVNANRYVTDLGNTFFFGAQTVTATVGPVLKPEEAWNIDTKIDDGHPVQGKVSARYWDSECGIHNAGAAANTNLDARYYVQNTDIACSLNFSHLF